MFNISTSDIIKEEYKSFNRAVTSKFWLYFDSKALYNNRDMNYISESYFVPLKADFNFFQNDIRLPLNYYEIRLLKFYKSQNIRKKNLINYFEISPIKDYNYFYRWHNWLQRKDYIDVYFEKKPNQIRENKEMSFLFVQCFDSELQLNKFKYSKRF